MKISTDTLRHADTDQILDGAISADLVEASLATDTGIVRATCYSDVTDHGVVTKTWRLDNDGATRCYVEAYEAAR